MSVRSALSPAAMGFLVCMGLCACTVSPLHAQDLRSISFEELLDASKLVCGTRLIGVKEVSEQGEVEYRYESEFKTFASLHGVCPEHITIQWKRSEHGAFDQVGSRWYLFLVDGSHLASKPYGGWKVMTLDTQGWDGSRIDIVAPESMANIRDIPQDWFEWQQLKAQYFSYYAVSFEARVIRIDKFESAIRERMAERK